MSTGTAVAHAFWKRLYDRDWDGIAASFTDDAVYWDVPTGPAAAAKGPKDIVARLQLGLAGLAGYEHFEGVLVETGDTVVTEHREVWHWDSGETASLPFVSVMRVEGDLIALWKDYWDLGTLMNAAPASWHERLANADLSWVYDATADGLAP
jgi:limonene-1,2-epoxide hydrolase